MTARTSAQTSASGRDPASLTASMLTTAGRTLSTMSAKPDSGTTTADDWTAAALSAELDCAELDCEESEPASAKPVPPTI